VKAPQGRGPRRAIATFGEVGAAAIAGVELATLRAAATLTAGQQRAFLRAARVLSQPLTAAQLKA
jgi:hypothetical protein